MAYAALNHSRVLDQVDRSIGLHKRPLRIDCDDDVVLAQRAGRPAFHANYVNTVIRQEEVSGINAISGPRFFEYAIISY